MCGRTDFTKVYSHPVLAELFLENAAPINVLILGHAAIAITAIAENATFKEDSDCLLARETAANSLEAPRATFPLLTPNKSKQSLFVSERKTDRRRECEGKNKKKSKAKKNKKG